MRVRVIAGASLVVLAACGTENADDTTVRPPPADGAPVPALDTVPPDFAAYPAGERFQGTPAPLDLASDTVARRFRSQLRWAPEDTVNFAGHLRLVLWGCGTSCQHGAVVDARTGRVRALPEAVSVGVAHRVDSRLLVLDPPERIAEAYPADVRPASLRPRWYVWADTGWVARSPSAARRP